MHEDVLLMTIYFTFHSPDLLTFRRVYAQLPVLLTILKIPFMHRKSFIYNSSMIALA